MTFRPLGNNVLVRRKPVKEMTATGLYIPELAQEQPDEGEVVAVGPGLRNEAGEVVPLVVAVGDKVMFTPRFIQIKVDGEKYILIKDTEILGVMES